jgi:acetolactate synthase-1/2/3 large subunit
MGFGLPAAVGARMGRPDLPTILVTGDGSFQMTLQELGTMMEQELDIKIIILDNHSLGMVRQLQQFYCDGRYMATKFKYHPDFSQLAKAYGIPGFTLTSEADVLEILPKVLAAPGPALLHCLVSADENVAPMVLAGKGIDEAIEC